MAMITPTAPARVQADAWGAAAVGVYLVAVPLVSVATPGLGGHDLARLAQIGVGGVCALALLARLARPTSASPLRGPGRLGLAALLVGAMLALAGIAGAPSPAMAGRETTLFLGLWAIAATVVEAGGRGCGLSAIAATASYAVVVMAIALVATLGGGVFDRLSLFVGYDNHRFYNHVQTAALPMVAAALFLPGLPRLARLGGMVGLGGGFALLFASAGRGTALALVAATALTWAAVGRPAWPVVRAMAAASAAGLALFALVFLCLPALASGGAPPMADYAASRMSSDQARGYLWQVALDQIRAAPWLGIGPMHAAHWPNLKAAHPHNVYLQVAAEWGLPMASLLLAAIATGLVRLRRCLRSATRDVPVGVALTIGCVAVLVDGLVSGNFVMPVSQVWIAVLAGWTVAWCHANRGASGHPGAGFTVRTRWVGAAAALLTLVSHLWLAASIAPEVEDLGAHLSQAREAFPSERTQPRFWSQGRF